MLQFFLAALHKGIHFRIGKNILQAHHLYCMRYLFKCSGCCAANVPGGRICCCKLRIFPFQGLQFPHQHIILIVRYGRCVLHVIFFVIALQQLFQLCNALFCCCFVHVSVSLCCRLDSSTWHTFILYHKNRAYARPFTNISCFIL